ncbi:MAG: shikimate dehydrogenase [Candidatus Omnitrophota bacterium]|nr:shikimate dehydrogenase [Candidatus Omnitrophota bacterium]
MKTYGLIGYPVKHSLSARMHNAAFKELGINAEYRLLEIKPEELENFLLKNIPVKDVEGKQIFSQEIIGFNITIPHKVRAKEIIYEHYPEVNKAGIGMYVYITGAINTVIRKDGKMYCLNTDVTGFRQSLQKDLKFNPKDKNVLLIGCGGAGRAVVAALAWRTSPRKIYIYEPNQGAFNSAKEHFSSFNVTNCTFEFISQEKQLPVVLASSDLLINASPVGMKEGDPSVVKKDWLHKDLSVYDLVYNRESQLLKDAKLLGLKNFGGLGMLLYQGVAAFEFWTTSWTKKNAPVEVMRVALEEGLKECRKK